VLSIAFDPAAPSTMYLGAESAGVHKSTNSGSSWNASGLSSRTIYALALDPSNPQVIYAGTSSDSGTLFWSTNGGGSWSARDSGLGSRSVYALCVDPVTSTTVYAGTDQGVYRSLDRGASWDPTPLSLKVYALTVRVDDGDTVLAGTSGGLYVSTDGGDTWRLEDSGVLNPLIQSLALDLANGLKYAGTDGSGAYRWYGIGQ
jgi:photosystem II stability/assembly factor-like uncharacterized protein